MFSIMDAAEAVKLIRDGDVIGLNSFVGTANPERRGGACISPAT